MDERTRKTRSLMQTEYDGETNLPVGVQLIDPHFGEAKLLQIAKVVE